MTWAGALVLPVVAALVLVWRGAGPRDRLALAVPVSGIALGLASTIAFALLFGGVRTRGVFITLDAAAWIAIAATALVVRRRAAAGQDPGTQDGRWSTAAAAVLVIGTALVAAVAFVAASSVFPHGEWDAWAQWNLRARFFFRGFSDGTWRNAFAPVLAWSHPDYPLLIPISVARLWIYGGVETVVAPIVFGGLLAAATVAAAGLAVARTRGAARGCLAAAVILACPSFVRYSAAQCADVAVGFYVLSAFILWSNADAVPGGRAHWILAGMSAALAGWTKNEGLAMCAVFMAAVAVERIRSSGIRGLRDVALVVAGAAPVLLAIVLFKIVLAPASYFTAEQSIAQAAGQLMDVGRLRLVSLALGRELWLTGATLAGVLPFLAAFVVVRGIDSRAPSAARAAVPVMLIVLVVYMMAYLVTPKDLAWQLRTSLDRLVLQVVPTLAWSVIAMCR